MVKDKKVNGRGKRKIGCHGTKVENHIAGRGLTQPVVFGPVAGIDGVLGEEVSITEVQ